jgi:hypothetical protein
VCLETRRETIKHPLYNSSFRGSSVSFQPSILILKLFCTLWLYPSRKRRSLLFPAFVKIFRAHPLLKCCSLARCFYREGIDTPGTPPAHKTLCIPIPKKKCTLNQPTRIASSPKKETRHGRTRYFRTRRRTKNTNYSKILDDTRAGAQSYAVDADDVENMDRLGSTWTVYGPHGPCRVHMDRVGSTWTV